MAKETNISKRLQKNCNVEYSLMIIAKKAVMYMVLTLIAAAFLAPIIFMFLGAFKTTGELAKVPFRWLPDKFRFDNFTAVFEKIPFFLYLGNTLIIVFFNMLGALFSNSLAAYGFSRIKWPGRDKLFILVIITMILPFQITMVPLYLMFHRWGWIGTFLPLTVTCFFGCPFYIFLIRQFLIGMPSELSSSAKVDGAGEFRIFWQLIMPLAKPALATVAIFAFIKSWNDFIGPLIFLSDQKLYTLSLAASMLKSNLDPQWTVLLALGSMLVIPVLIVFFVLQKYFIQGVAMSGIKG